MKLRMCAILVAAVALGACRSTNDRFATVSTTLAEPVAQTEALDEAVREASTGDGPVADPAESEADDELDPVAIQEDEPVEPPPAAAPANLADAKAMIDKMASEMEMMVAEIEAAGTDQAKVKEIGDRFKASAAGMKAEGEELNKKLTDDEKKELEAYGKEKMAPLMGKLMAAMMKSQSAGEKEAEEPPRADSVSLSAGETGGSGEAKVEVAKVVARKNMAVQRCYEQALRDNPDEGGEIKVSFTVGTAGTVTEVNVSGATGGFSDCIKSKFMGIRGLPLLLAPQSFTQSYVFSKN